MQRLIGIVAASVVLTASALHSQDDSAAVEQRMYALNESALAHVKNSEYAARSRPRRWVQNNLAWLLATAPDSKVRDGARALLLAEQLVAWRRDDPAYLDTFAAAYAELSRFEDAVRTQKRAVGGLGRGSLRDEYRRHLKSYENKTPWREP